jgi:hypothetical protein
VNLYFTTNGISVEKLVTTDGLGTFQYTYYPSDNEIGPIEVLAKHPFATNREYLQYTPIIFELIGNEFMVTEKIYIVGMKITPDASATPVYTFLSSASQTYNNLVNLGERTLTGITATVVTDPSFNFTVDVTVTNTLAAYGSAPISLTLTSDSVIPLTPVDIIITSNEGASARTTVYVTGNSLLTPKLT